MAKAPSFPAATLVGTSIYVPRHLFCRRWVDLLPVPTRCCRSSGVEHSLGKGEVESSNLSGSTIFKNCQLDHVCVALQRIQTLLADSFAPMRYRDQHYQGYTQRI